MARKKVAKAGTVRPPQNRPWGWWAALTVLLMVCAGGIGAAALIQTSGGSATGSSSGSGGDDIAGVQTYPDLGRQHTQGQVDYKQQPPVGGSHNPVWLDCTGTVYDKPVSEEKAVHSLEHGAVWITYQPSLPDDERAALARRVQGQPYTMMSPNPDQQSPIVLSAWGHQLQLDSAGDKRVGDFLSTYVQGSQTPEPGASCSSGRM